MKSLTPEEHCKRVFLNHNTLFVLLTLQIIYQGHAEDDTIFENSSQLTSRINTYTILLTGQGVFCKCISLHSW